jgi:hypothetical protein
MLVDIRAEKATHHWEIAKKRSAILNFLNILAHQPSEHDGLSVQDLDARRYLSRAENRLINHIIRQRDRLGRGAKKSARISVGIDKILRRPV